MLVVLLGSTIIELPKGGGAITETQNVVVGTVSVVKFSKCYGRISTLGYITRYVGKIIIFDLNPSEIQKVGHCQKVS